MQIADIKKVAEREPFRPFTLRLNNGAEYTFENPRDFGAPKDFHVIMFFGESDWAMIDADSIAEVVG